jgi:hypothetical protein
MMRLSRTIWLFALLAALIGTRARAQEHATEPAAPTAHAAQEVTEDRPTLPADPKWAGIVVIVIIAMFVLAATIGPIVRSEMPEELPVPHGHGEVVGHEDHGAHESDHGHGHGH